MSPDREFYEKLEETTKENEELKAVCKSAQHPKKPNYFLVRISINTDQDTEINLAGFLDVGYLACGDGNLRIPTRIDKTSGDEKGVNTLLAKNSEIFQSKNAHDGFSLLGLRIGERHGDYHATTFGSNYESSLTLERDKYVCEDPWRRMPYFPEPDEFVPSAIGLAAAIENDFGWKITFLPFEETNREYSNH